MSRQATRAKTSYLVCATARSGSNLLCETLMSTGLLGNPDIEYFYPPAVRVWSRRWKTHGFGAYVQRVIAESTTSNGVFGVKLMWGYFPQFIEELAGAHTTRVMSDTFSVPSRDPQLSLWKRWWPQPAKKVSSVSELLESAFPDVHYVFVTREDKVRQAVSHARALQTGRWTSRDEGASGETPVFDFHQIDRLLTETIEHEAAWNAYFSEAGVHPLTVTYENLARDPQRVVEQVSSLLGIRAPAAPQQEVGLRKQADSMSEEWVERYHDHKRANPAS